MRLLLVCDYGPALLDAFFETLSRIPVTKRVLLRKLDNVVWQDPRAEVIGLPVPVSREQDRKGLATILSIITYLIMATFVGTFEVVRRQLDAIVAIYSFPQGLAAVLIGYLTRRKVTVLTDGGDIDVLLSNTWIRPLMIASLRKAAVVAALNRTKASRLVPLGIKAQVCPTMGVDTSRFAYTRFEAKKEGSILFVGRLEVEKNIDILLRACYLLRQDGVQFDLLIIGEGPLKKQLSETVTRMNMADCVDIKGYVPHVMINQYFERSAIFVLPSRREGVSVALVEAMSSGCFCIVSDIADNRGLIHYRYNGSTFHADDEQDLADELRWVISQPATELSSISANARHDADKHYSLQAVADSLGLVLSGLETLTL